MPKIRIHREWFMPLSIATRSKCSCGKSRSKRNAAGLDPYVYSWGEYHNAKWRTVQYVCQSCFDRQVLPRLKEHAKECGCAFELVSRSGYSLPPWILP